MAWLRWEDGCSSDQKWRVIAKRSNVAPGMVVAVWAAVLESACRLQDEGRYELDPEVVGETFGLEPEKVQVILGNMQGRVLDGPLVTNWPRYNGPTSTERVRRWREEQKKKR